MYHNFKNFKSTYFAKTNNKITKNYQCIQSPLDQYH